MLIPPLISEDLDETFSVGARTATPSGEEQMATDSVDESSLPNSRQSPKPFENTPDAPADPNQPPGLPAQSGPLAPGSEAYDLGEQLQRSAQEDLSDLEVDGVRGSKIRDGTAPHQLGEQQDVTMTDADVEAEPDKVVPGGSVPAQITETPEEDADGDAKVEGAAAGEDLADQILQPAEGDLHKKEDKESANGEREVEDGAAESDVEEAGSDNEESTGSAEGESSASESGSASRSDSKSGSDSESGSESGEEEEEEEEDDDDDSGETEEEPKAECLFCQDSSAATGESTKLSLTCSQCSSRSHLKCAQDKDSGKLDSIPEWQCPECRKKTSQSQSPKEQTARSKNSAPRLVRDLLPVTRGVQKPNSHSIFAQPLISESEDGGRALRKRKSPTQEPGSVDKRRRKITERVPTTAASTAAVSVDSSSTAMSTRRSSQLKIVKPTARVLQHRPFNKPPPHKFILAFRLDQSKIEAILNKPPRPGKRRDRKAQQRRREQKIPPPIYQPPVPKFPALPTHNLIFPSAFTDREAELNAKPYGGILSEIDADTSRSLPQLKDREIFEIARKEAEEERRKTSAAAEAEINGAMDASAVTPGAAPSTTKPNRSTVSGPPSKIKCIQFGKHVIDTFYAAPYPEEYSHESRLFICEFCLKYLPSEFVAYRHKLKCPAKHPPGDEIYRDGTVSVWEVDGRKKTEYCQCLCLMAKMFLGSKTLYYDVEPFLFYILTEYDELGYHFVGYFSKEKRPASQNNVSCILVMPIHQRKGYATFLIDFSYLLTRIEKKEGSPEKPLSDMGLTAYRSYWDLTISRHLLALVESKTPFSTRTLMSRTGMTADDVIHSLERLYAFIKDPVTKTYAIRFDQSLYERIVDEFDRKGHRKLKPDLLVWTPYVMGRSDREILDGQGPLSALAPRNDDEDVNDEDEEEGQLDVDSQAIASKAGKSIVGDTDVMDTDPDMEQLSPRSKSKSAKAASRSQSVREQDDDPADVKDPDLVDELGHVAPGPPSTGALNGIVSTQVAAEEPTLNGLTNGTSTLLQQPPVDPQLEALKEQESQPQPSNGNESSIPATKPEDGLPQLPSSPPLKGYALAYREHAIPPTRFQIDPPIPPSMLRRQGTKKRTASSAFGLSPHKTNGIAGFAADLIGTPNAIAVRSSPRNAGKSSSLGSTAGNFSGAPSLDGTGRGSASPKIPGTPVRRSGRRSGLVNVATVDGNVDEEDEEDEEDEDEEDAPAEDDDEVAQSKTEDDNAGSSSSDGEEEDDEQATSVAVVTDDDASGEDGDEESDEVDVAEEDEDEEDDEESADDDPNDPDAVPEETEDSDESEDAEEDDGDPDVDVDVDLADDEDGEGTGDGDGVADEGDEDAEAEEDD